MIYRFICFTKNKIAYSSSSRIGIKLNVPDFIDLPDDSFIDILDHLHPATELAGCVPWRMPGVPKREYVLVEDDCGYDIDWDRVDPVWLSDPKSWEEFINYVNFTNCELPRFEHLIFDNNAKIVDGCWVLQEENNHQDHHSRIMMYLWRSGSKRIPRFEDMISKQEDWSEKYLRSININLSEWNLNDIKRSPVWIYEYCKKNGFNEELYNAMSMYSFTNADSIYVKKFMNTKKFVPKNVRKNIPDKKAFVCNLIKQNGWGNIGSRSIRIECLNRGMDIGLGYITQCRRKVASGEW